MARSTLRSWTANASWTSPLADPACITRWKSSLAPALALQVQDQLVALLHLLCGSRLDLAGATVSR